MKKLLFILFGIFLIFLIGTSTYIAAPDGAVFPTEVQYHVDEPLSLFIDNLRDSGIIKNPKLFKVLLVVTRYDTRIKPNIYRFTEPQNMFMVFSDLVHNSEQAKGVKVVIPEGSTVRDIQNNIRQAFPEFAKQTPSSFSKTDEGYLFPDTYFFSINSTEADIVVKLKKTFNEKTADLFAGKSEREIRDAVILASILEREGRGKEEQKMISGILHKRMAIGMPLQVDATFLYTIGKGSVDLTTDDLKSDSPYNTYTRIGLPIGPIGNPGLETLEAALHPTDSPYLYYLHDKKGGIHYAKTFDEHIRNKNKYLK